MTTCRYINSGQSNFEYEYLGEFETEFKNILGHESGAQVCSFDGKKQRSKISCYCPFKLTTTPKYDKFLEASQLAGSMPIAGIQFY
jgi:hypothetical protein